MRCPHCANDTPDESLYCEKCGYDLRQTDPEAREALEGESNRACDLGVERPGSENLGSEGPEPEQSRSGKAEPVRPEPETSRALEPGLGCESDPTPEPELEPVPDPEPESAPDSARVPANWGYAGEMDENALAYALGEGYFDVPAHAVSPIRQSWEDDPLVGPTASPDQPALGWVRVVVIAVVGVLVAAALILSCSAILMRALGL